MASVTCDIPASYLAGLTRRAGTSGISSLGSEALAGQLDTPLHTLFQLSISASPVGGLCAQAVTCAKIPKHGDFSLGHLRGGVGAWIGYSLE